MRYIIFIAIVVAMSACKSNQTSTPVDPHAGHDHAKVDPHAGHAHAKAEAKTEHTGEIIFTPQQAKAAGLQVEQVARAPFAAVIKTSGKLVAPQGDEVVISAPCSGTVTFTKASIADGASVGSGEVIATIKPSVIADGDISVQVKSEYRAAKNEMERAERLIKDKIISQSDYEQIRQRYDSAKASFDALSPASTASGIVARSPIGGYVKSIDVAQGAYVSTGEAIATVTKNRRVQLRAEVAQRHYAELSTVRSANFILPYNNKLYKLSDLGGRLVSTGKSQSGDSFYIPVTFEFDNRGDIVPGSFVEVFLVCQPKGSAISVPVGAITEEQGLFFVYVQIDEEGFLKKEVATGQNNGERVEILSGLNVGDNVVTKGTLQVKLAANSSVIPEGHSH